MPCILYTCWIPRDEILGLFLFFTIGSCDSRQIKKKMNLMLSLSFFFSLEQVYMRIPDICTWLKRIHFKYSKVQSSKINQGYFRRNFLTVISHRGLMDFDLCENRSPRSPSLRVEELKSEKRS